MYQHSNEELALLQNTYKSKNIYYMLLPCIFNPLTQQIYVLTKWYVPQILPVVELF